MKIRTQLNLLIIVLVAIPLSSVIAMPFYHYLSSPQRFLLQGYKEIRDLDEIDLSENEWELLKGKLEEIPPNVQTVVYYNNQVLISTFPEFKAGTELSLPELFEFISSTSNDYDYQVQSPLFQHTPGQKLNESQMQEKRNNRSYSLLVISRAKVPSERHGPNRFLIPIYCFIIFFEAAVIFIIVRLSKTIASSITMLEEATQKIADGQLDTEIVMPKQGQYSNEITSLAESLEKMRVSLKDDQQRRTKFIMGISHDLRTPVALIKGYTEAISDGVVNNPEAVKKSLSIIHTKADQLENMINDLINYVKLNNSEWLHQLESINLEPFVSDFAKSAAATAEIYHRNINTDVKINPDIKVPMDKALVSRALENIFSNAVRYSGDNDTIEIKALEDESTVKISIKDTGKGISEEDQQHIFDLFYRGTNSRREQGMGIGLSVVKTIIDAHGWKIDVESKLGEGTKFTISIPLKETLK